MATALEEAARKKKVESDLLAQASAGDTSDDTGTDPDPDPTDDTSDDSSDDSESVSQRTIYAPATKRSQSYRLVPIEEVNKQAAAPDSQGHIDLGPPKTLAATTYPTIAEDQPGAPETSLKIPTPTPESPSGPTDLQTDPETGQRYVTDAGGTMVPHAELATPADKEAFKPSDVTLPSRTVEGTAETQPAPDTLNQVERATLVKLPPKGYKPPAPDTLTQVEKAQPVTYPTIAEDQGAPPTPPKVLPAQPVTGATPPSTTTTTPTAPVTPTAPKPRASQFGLTPEEYKAEQAAATAPTTTQATAPPDASGLNINTDYTAQKGSYAPGRAGDGKIQGIILHSSDGTEQSGINQLTRGGVSAHYFVTKDGRIYQFVNDQDTAYHAGVTKGPYANYNNSNTIGIEQEHYDPGPDAPAEFRKNGQAWSPAQVAATAKLVAYLKAKYGINDNQIMGHSAVAPGRKQDPYNYPWQGFFSAVDKQGGAAAPGAAATAPAGATAAATSGQGYLSGKATTFGYKDPDDNGVGSPKLGGLSTNNTDLIGIAVPPEALRSYVSAHPADWRKARVDVVGQNGQHVLVPIVDLGPGDTSGAVVADFTQGLTNLTGNTGEQNYQFKIIPNAGPDVMKNPQEFADEQAAIRAGIDTGARMRPQAPVAAKRSYVLAPMDPAKSIATQTAAQYDQQGQVATLDDLNRNTQNPGQLWKLLGSPIPGVSDANRKAYQDNFKQELTKYAQDFYGEKDPDKAFQRAVGDANLGTFGQDVGRTFAGTIGQADLGLNQMSKNSDLNQLDRFAQLLHPESDGPGRAAFIKTITDIKDPALQSQTIGALWANLDPQKQAAVDINGLVQSAQNVSSPEFQTEQQRSIDRKSAWVAKQFEPDPTLKGTPGQFWSGQTGALLANTALAFTAPAIRTSAFAAQIYNSAQDRLKSEHPDWTDQQLSDESSKSTFLQLAPQELLVAASHGILAPILNWASNPVARFGIGGGIHLATGAAGGAIMQAGANVAEGQPIGQDVGQAAISGAVQAAPFAIHGAIHGAITPPEAPTKAPLGEEPVTPPPVTGPKGGEVRGAEPETMSTGGEEAEAAPTVNEPQVEEPTPVVHPTDLEPTPDSQAHIDLNTLADMSDLPDEQSRREALAAIQPEQKTADTTRAEGQFIPSDQWQDVPDWAAVPPGGTYRVNMETGAREARWEGAIPGPETVFDQRTGKYQTERTDDQARAQAAAEAENQRIRAEEEARAQQVQRGVQEQTGTNQPVGQGQAPVGRTQALGGQGVPGELGRVRDTMAVALSPSERAAIAPDVQRLEQARSVSPEAFQQAYVALREKVISRFQPILDQYGGGRAEQGSGKAFAAEADPQGRFQLHTDDAQGANDARTIVDNGGDIAAHLHSAIQEEIIHFAHHAALRDEWMQAGGPQSGQDFHQFAGPANHRILLDAIARRDALEAAGHTKQARVITEALHDSSNLYHSKGDPAFGEARLQEILKEAATGDYRNANDAVYELARQLMQTGAKSDLSEANYKYFWDKYRPFFERALAGLQKMYRMVKGTLAKSELGQLIRNVERTIAENDRAARGELTPQDRILKTYRQESDVDLASAAAGKDANALAVLKDRYPSGLPDHVLDIMDPRRRAAAAAAQEEARRQHQAEVEGAGARPEGKEHLLQAIVKAGGLPHPLRMKNLAARGEKATGEMARLYDAWKALPLEAKKQLGKEGVTYNKLFTKTGEGLDTFRDNLSQHPDGYRYGTVGELLSDTERALSGAGQGKRLFGPEAPKPPIEADSESMRPLGYRAAVRLPNGDIHAGRLHDDAYARAGSPREQPGLNFGFVDKVGRFVTMDEADRILEQATPVRSPLSTIPRKRVFSPEAPRAPRPQRDESDFAFEVQKARAARKLKPEISRGTPTEFRWDTPEGFRLEHETTGSGIKEPPPPPPPPDTTGELFPQKPKTPAPVEPKLAEDKIRELNSSTFRPEDSRTRTWKLFTNLLRGFHSMVPEAGSKGASEGTIKIQQWERYLKGLGPKIKTDSANIVRKVLDPVLNVTGETHPGLSENLSKLNERIKARESAGKPVPPKWTAERARLEGIQNTNPLHLFQQAVLYRDLYFRSQVRVGTDVYGNPRYMELPMGLTKNEVIDKLVDLKKQIANLTPEQQAGVKDSLRSHYRLVRDIKDELADRGFVIPKELTNPYYYPHQLLEHMSGHLGSPRITTQDDFRNYLVNPVGSEKPIETNYVKAMLQHLVEVRSHNARQDATEKYIEGIDRSAPYKRSVADENNVRYEQSGGTKNFLPSNEWERRARADGLEIYTANKRLPLRMEAMLDRDKIAARIGHNLEGPNIAEQLRRLGVQLTSDDIKTALSTTEPIKYALHPKEIEALNGVIGRQDAASKASFGWGHRANQAQQKLLQAWKWWHLFSPTSAVRYNYNLMTVDLEKAATVDPAIFKKLGPAFNEVRQFMKTGKYTSPEMESAVEHDVVHSPTAHELGKAHEFPQLRDLVAPEPKLSRLANWANMGAKFAGMRDRTFRYAKYLADLERLKAGKSVPEVALHRDLEAQPSLEARAAQNAREMFVDYNAISPAGQSLRKNMIPFYSWIEGNFRYHANLFRNFSDMSTPNKAEFIGKAAPRYVAKMLFGRATRGFLLRAAMVNGGLAAWNAWQMQQNHIKDSDLSDEDKRHLFIITGKDPQTGKVSLTYVPTALSDVASWMGGPAFGKAYGDYMQNHDLGKAVQHWMGGWSSDVTNKVVSSIRPEVLGTVGALSHQNFFPNVFKPKQIPSYDTRHQLLSTIFDQPTADTVESMINNHFLPSKNLGDNLKQMVLQQRYRDPQQENYYAAKDRVEQFLEDKQRDRMPGTSNNPQTEVVRNLRKSMYAGDVDNALKFANILVNEFGYDSKKFAASLKALDPLSALPKDLKQEYMKQLSDFDKEQLADAYKYTAGLQTDKPNATAEARAIFGPANKPTVNQAALKAAILAMQDQTRREAAAQRLMQHSMAPTRP